MQTRTALVTGASTGIGLATSRALRQHGYRVFAGVRNDADAHRLAQDGLEPIHLDVTSDGDVAAAVATVGERLDVLVNNAGIAVAGPVESLTDLELRTQFEVNLFGLHRVTRELLPALIAARGRIVNLSSISGRIGAPFLSAYAASKFAVEGYSDSLRREVAPFGVHVSLIEPGQVDTPIWGKAVAAGTVAEPLERYRARAEPMIAAASDPNTPRLAAEVVAAAILKAATSARPRARYAMPRRDALIGRLAPTVPDALMDRLVARDIDSR